MKIDKNLSDIFDLEEQPKTELTEPSVEGKLVTSNMEEKIEDDYDSSRSNLQVLLAQGQDALMHALEVAKQSEHPRAFEVVGNLMKQLADVNQQMMDLHSQKQKLDNPKGSEPKKEITNNSIFVGSTDQLNKLIADMKKDKE